jgi:hypothetical protein
MLKKAAYVEIMQWFARPSQHALPAGAAAAADVSA